MTAHREQCVFKRGENLFKLVVRREADERQQISAGTHLTETPAHGAGQRPFLFTGRGDFLFGKTKKNAGRIKQAALRRR